jgi:transposase-like protein
MAKRKLVRRGRAFFERVLAERDREGLSFPELSARSGVPASTLQRWGRKLSSEGRIEEAAPPFVEVVPAAEEPPSGRIEVLLRSGHVLYLDPGPPCAGLSELVTLLESC